MGKICGQLEFFSLGGQYYSLGHPSLGTITSHFGIQKETIVKLTNEVESLKNEIATNVQKQNDQLQVHQQVSEGKLLSISVL